MAKQPNKTISDIDVAIAVIAHEAARCFCGEERDASRQPKKLVSCIGGIFWGKPGERWPTTKDGKPLMPWLQVVCAEMDGVYGAFYRKQAICFYLNEDIEDAEEVSEHDRCNFVVRTYELDDKLAPLDRPAALKGHPFHQVSWKKQLDYPSLSKYYGLFDSSVYSELRDRKRFKYQNRSGIKIAGWPTPVQKDQEYPGAHELQIDMTSNFAYGDSGIAYLSRTGEQWYVVFECC